ncbi:VOC family protein [Pedobacter ureilyticus]|jgi:predicted lactoylglutathione lyase|uniref:VOC family protein n=1 Tax=Pedobacter ureilyticus TaxID=1393051 RepID=A0ABW9J2S0_9SPHI|nr:VOC family protein [Pedobacter helvus]
MAKQIFVNIPVKDLNVAIEFYTKLGFTFNQQFTDENATCMIVSENIMIMLLRDEFFKQFTPKAISNAKESTEVLICISAESREEVDQYVRLAIEAGGKALVPKQDHGWMYGHGFEDLDGHMWEISYMDMSALPENP